MNAFYIKSERSLIIQADNKEDKQILSLASDVIESGRGVLSIKMNPAADSYAFHIRPKTQSDVTGEMQTKQTLSSEAADIVLGKMKIAVDGLREIEGMGGAASVTANLILSKLAQ